MKNMFKELEDLGIKLDSDFSVYNKPKEKSKKAKLYNHNVVIEAVYQRKVVCPVCDTTFLTSSVRAGRVRFVDTELDLRPVYEGFDPVIYDVVACPMCGYAHLNKYFKIISDTKIGKVKNNISYKFQGKEYPMEYTYDDALERYKLALMNCIVCGDTNGVRAYLCLKISWIYRGYRELLKEEGSTDYNKINELVQLERQFAKNAYDGFLIAYENESFPIVGIEQNNIEYLLAELLRRQGEFAEAKKWLSRVIIKKNSKRLSAKIYDVKELINNNIMD